jgi:hypothetical protein
MSVDTEVIEVMADGEVVEVEPDREDRRHRVVTVANKDNADTIRLRVPVTATIAAVIETMYAEFRLTRQPQDRLTCRRDGQDVYQFAELTLARYLHDGHCPHLHWSFVGDTGGA